MSVVLISGCSSGFGMGAAVALAHRGETVVATMRDLEKAEPLLTAADGTDLDLLSLDVTDPSSRNDAVSKVIDKHGRIDVLINNAGLCSLGAAEILGEDDLRAQFETNVFGAFALIEAVLPDMRARKSGRIVNITSVAAFIAPQFMTGYAASKHAMDAITAGMALELQDFNIYMTSVAPAAYGTGLSANAKAPTADTPYGERPVRRYEEWISTMDGRADISQVVEAIVEAATVPSPKLRYLVTPSPPPFAAIVAEKNKFDEGRLAAG